MRRGQTVAGLLLGIGLWFAVLGQFYFAYRREYVWDGVLLWCAAVLAFGLLLRQVARVEHGQARRPRLAWVREHPLRTMVAAGGVGLAFLAGWQARYWPAEADFSVLFWTWLVGVAMFLLAFVPERRERGEREEGREGREGGERGERLKSLLRTGGERGERLKERLKSLLRAREWVRRRGELAGLAALLAMALVVRAVDLEHVPANLGGDEGTQGVAALELVEPPLGNPFATGWFSVPTMSFLAYGLAMRLCGAGIAGLRALSALAGALTVLTTFLLARELWGRRVGWLAAAVLACSHYHVHFSRLGSNQIGDGLLATLALYLVVRALRSRREITFALAGAVIGLGWYGYFGSRLIGIIVALYLAWRAEAEHRFLARHGRLVLILLVATLVVTLPLLLYYAGHPADFSSRSRQVSIFSSGWLAREQEITGRSAASLLLEQFWKSVSAFHYTLDPTFWYRPSIPLLDFVSGVLLVLGLVWATAHWRWPANGLVLLWFWLALFVGWVMTENPPSSQRMIIITPAVASLAGLGLNWLVELGRRVGEPANQRISKSANRQIGESVGDGRRIWGGVAAMVLAGVAVANLYYYFVVYTPTRVYGNPTAEVATELGRYLAQQDDGRVVYFHAPPFMYWGFGTLQFLARSVEGVDVPPAEEGEWPVPDLGRGARFVFLPERLSELGTVRARIPGGVEVPVYSAADGRLLYVMYEVASRD